MKKIKIGVIFGGKSGEHEVSLVSGASVIENLDKKKYEVVQIGITKSGKWFTSKNALEALKHGEDHLIEPMVLNTLEDLDCVFPVLHGPFGEDGTIQGFLELLNIPYVGCGVLSSALAMDKLMAKTVFSAHNLPQPPYIGIARNEWLKNKKKILKEICKKLGRPPYFVKPANLGSSVGISKVKHIKNLEHAINLATKFDRRIVIEKGINAREIECSVLGNENPIASVAGEVVSSREFYDYYAKYVDNASKLIIPAKLPKKKTEEIKKLALLAYKALNCEGMARVDFLMDKRTAKLYISEINTIPGFTSISMYPKLLRASGISYKKLLDALILLALSRHKEKQKNKVSFESGSDWYK